MDIALILLIVIAILSVIGIISLFITKQVNSTNVVAIMLIPITLLTAYFAYTNGCMHQKNISVDMDDRLTVQLNDKIIKNFPHSTNLYKQLSGSDTTNDYIPPTPQDEQKQEIVNYSLSNNIIDMISEFESMKGILSPDVYESWLNTFRKWFNSDIIRKTWDSIKSTYDAKIRSFIENEIIRFSNRFR
jgi:hypothetical protein